MNPDVSPVKPPASPTIVLATTLGGREIGLAVVTAEGPLRLQVLNLRKLRSREAKEVSFRRRIARLVELHSVTDVLVVTSSSVNMNRELVEAQLGWIEGFCAERQIPKATQRRADVIEATIGRRGCARDLAAHLEVLYPELWSRVPSALPMPPASPLTWRTRRVTPMKERYWSNPLAAFAAARLAFERTFSP